MDSQQVLLILCAPGLIVGLVKIMSGVVEGRFGNLLAGLFLAGPPCWLWSAFDNQSSIWLPLLATILIDIVIVESCLGEQEDDQTQ